jgi:hypothetical protein
MDFKRARKVTRESDDDAARTLLRTHAALLRSDEPLLSELGLRLDPGNVVEFGPAALKKVAAAHLRESSERKRLEALSQANYAAQARTHAAVIDLLDARDHADLARRLDEVTRGRFSLIAGVLALEGPRGVPEGWRPLAKGQVDMILGPRRPARMGPAPTALGLFGEAAGRVGSVAMARIALGGHAGVIAFGGADPDAFTADMGAELVTFLARVVERTAERWPLDGAPPGP